MFENRETGAITIAQAPNLLLWLVIAATAARWTLSPEGRWGTAVQVAFWCGLLLWALDELVRGVNPWRRCLGASVLLYGLVTVLR